MATPNQLPFAAVRAFVMQGSKVIARAISSMMARRIAKALNHAQREADKP